MLNLDPSSFPAEGGEVDFTTLGICSSSEDDKDIFEEKKQKAWEKINEARCDMKFRLNMTRRTGVNFVSIWQKSVYGRTLKELKEDDSMIEHFAKEMAPVITETLGTKLRLGGWCICTSPKRRHKEKNFATLVAERIAVLIDIPFYEDVAECNSRHRVGAEFTIHNKPKERNVIVYDDFVTTGNTLHGMKEVLVPLGYNTAFFASCNNKL